MKRSILIFVFILSILETLPAWGQNEFCSTKATINDAKWTYSFMFSNFDEENLSLASLFVSIEAPHFFERYAPGMVDADFRLKFDSNKIELNPRDNKEKYPFIAIGKLSAVTRVISFYTSLNLRNEKALPESGDKEITIDAHFIIPFNINTDRSVGSVDFFIDKVQLLESEGNFYKHIWYNIEWERTFSDMGEVWGSNREISCSID